MSVVVGTAGHIDHGKTTLLRALTGIDADRLPEERRRGMTIDVGYAHLALDDASVIDFVDVPGHDRLVGNMLVGAGEVDAALLVAAADDGPNAQTLEHLELLDALGIRDGIAIVTKGDLVPEPGRRAVVAGEVEALLARTSLVGAPVLVASAVTGEGLDGVRQALAALARRVEGRPSTGRDEGRARLAIDRVFAVRGRGTVVTGTLRRGRISAGDILRLEPDGGEVRVREVQVRGRTVAEAGPGRTALLLRAEPASLRRGQVLAADGHDGPAGDRVVSTSRVLVALRPAPRLDARRRNPVIAGDRERLRLHLGTDAVDALVVRGPREGIDLPGGASLAILRLERRVAAAPGDRFALRRPSPGSAAGGGVVFDPLPPRSVSRRRLDARRAAALASDPPGSAAARLDLHGVLPGPSRDEPFLLAGEVRTALRERALAAVRAAGPTDDGATDHDPTGRGTADRDPTDRGPADGRTTTVSVAVLRRDIARSARRLVTLDRAAADGVADLVLDGLVTEGSLARNGDSVHDPRQPGGTPPELLAAMDRLEAALAVLAPPPLADAARAARCPIGGIRSLEAAGRIVRVEDDLAWAATTYRQLAARALSLAAVGPLAPAALRDATGTSRRYVLPILEDLGRRGLLRRTEAGHVLGPKAIARAREREREREGASGEPAVEQA